MRLEAKARVVRGFGQRLLHQTRADALSLPCRYDGDQPQTVPIFDLVAVTVGDDDGGSLLSIADLVAYCRGQQA